MARKKIVLVLVEGPSDDTALGVILSRLFDKNKVHIEIMHGDITANYSIEPNDIVSALGDIVREYANAMHFSQIHFQQVIHIVDMDGAYIPEAFVIENPSAVKPVYTLTEIQTARPDQLILRNKHKQEKLNRISNLKKVWVSVPNQAYYMSSNLDHVLYGKINSTDEEKENNAYAFARKYRDDVDGFLDFISDSDFSKTGDYKESWEFIKKEHHSLERYSNLGICFADIRKERIEQQTINKTDI
ncbi:MAG: hypothetical protein Q4P22_02840 [Eubacteriales bacterium]|nr:hypothetical protein [Eubacteriales bacterium]